MNVEWKLFAGAAGFAALVGGLYWFVSYEHAGTTMLGLSSAAFLMVAAYLLVVGRRAGMRASDRSDADPGDDAGATEYFPSSSVWPFVAATGAVVLGLGLVFGAGVGSLGVLLLGTAIAGYASEANAKP
ncbi:MAG TPA: cytochrome c oxidase subunit 4 [Acidimicrobiales bacterium]|nr:cytochrome c oxidase subunit 4 [Acidimicrobiales bacterium]